MLGRREGIVRDSWHWKTSYGVNSDGGSVRERTRETNFIRKGFKGLPSQEIIESKNDIILVL